MINIELLSKAYSVNLLTIDDVDMIYELCKDNELYYKHCPPFCTKDSIISDLKALPPNKTYEDKYYIGFIKDNELMAVMDLIDGYPNDDTAFIGFFMMNKKYQGQGIGTLIISDVCKGLKKVGFKYIRLGYVETNPQSKAFWEKNGFKPTGVVAKQELYNVVVMQKEL